METHPHKPLCDYFKTIIDQINEDIQKYNGIKFSLGLSLQFLRMKKMDQENIFKDKSTESKVLFFMIIM